MKTLVVLFLFVLCANTLQIQNIENPVFGYISKYGIPLAEKLKRAEDDLIKSGSRIFGGEPSALGQHPYQAGLISEIVDTSNKSLCSGSLISANKVLTAAHCWYDGENQAWVFEVVLGTVFVFSGGTRVRTSAVSMHPQWSPSLIQNDIAVVYLPNSVAISAEIAPIALPTATEIDQDFAGSRAIASGFGITQEGESVAVDQALSHVSLKVIKNSICSIAYPFIVQSSNICTNGLGGSPCRGDSGGPLVANGTGRNILIGVTSFGSAFGCQSLLPAVYTRVTSYLSFIYQHI